MPIGGFVSSAYTATRFAVSHMKLQELTLDLFLSAQIGLHEVLVFLCWSNYKAIVQQLSDLQFSNLVEYSLILVMLHPFLKCDCGSEQGC